MTAWCPVEGHIPDYLCLSVTHVEPVRYNSFSDCKCMADKHTGLLHAVLEACGSAGMLTECRICIEAKQICSNFVVLAHCSTGARDDCCAGDFGKNKTLIVVTAGQLYLTPEANFVHARLSCCITEANARVFLIHAGPAQGTCWRMYFWKA